MAEHPPTRSGYVAIIGRPNVGKSTLLNRVLGQKLSITSRKPQTTRHQLIGIKTSGNVQALFVDTPGLLKNTRGAMGRYMNRTAIAVLRDVDVIVMVVDRMKWQEDDDFVLNAISGSARPALLAINKTDLIREKEQLLPYLAKMQRKFPFAEMVPVCALSGHNVDRLESLLMQHLPEGPHYYEDDRLTDRNERFLVTEIIREKITRQLGDEIPYATTVQIVSFEEKEKLVRIEAEILVDREGQKKILIGSEGKRIGTIGSEARRDIEALLRRKAHLQLWVKVKSGWAADEAALKHLGYE